MKFVLDSSVLVKLFLDEDGTLEMSDLLFLGLSKNIKFMASDLVFYEVGNVLWRNLKRRKRDGREFIERLYYLDIDYRPVPKEMAPQVLDFAFANNISFYDGTHVFLAKTNNADLVTEDRKLQKKFSYAVGIKRALNKVK